MRHRQRTAKWPNAAKPRAARKRTVHATYPGVKRNGRARKAHSEMVYVPYTLEEHLEL